MNPNNIICLWFNKDAEEAARFYAATFPDSAVTAVHLAPGDYPSGKEGEVITVEFTVMGILCGAEWRHRLQAQRGFFLSGGDRHAGGN